jgi:undecaprenyl diphosphate synthase
MQSTLEEQDSLHVAIIMDGNGRWAERRDMPRSAGHREGIEAVRRVVEAAPDLGIGALTLFAFSSDNWRRPPLEVEVLMLLLRQYLRRDVRRLADSGVRLTVIGRRDRLPEGLAQQIAAAEAACALVTLLALNVALDYSARDAIANAASAWLGDDAAPRAAFNRLLAWQGQGAGRDVDLLIRTGGEKRLSDFLLWECAYAELCFIDALWPDFDTEGLSACVADFWRRDRRFGGLSKPAPLVAAE